MKLVIKWGQDLFVDCYAQSLHSSITFWRNMAYSAGVADRPQVDDPRKSGGERIFRANSMPMSFRFSVWRCLALWSKTGL